MLLASALLYPSLPLAKESLLGHALALISPLSEIEKAEQPGQVIEDVLALRLEDRTFWNLCVSDISLTLICRSREPDFNTLLLLIPAVIDLHFTVEKSEPIIFLCESPA